MCSSYIMKKFLFLVLLLSFAQKSNGQYLISLIYHYKVWSGHGVEMYYSTQSLNKIYNKVISLDSAVTERELLEMLGTPLISNDVLPSEGDDSCAALIQSRFKLRDWFHCFYVNKKTVNTKTHYIELKVIKAEYSLCKFVLYTNYFSSYNCNFKVAGTLLNHPKRNVLNLNRRERQLMRKIKYALEDNIVNKSDSPYYRN